MGDILRNVRNFVLLVSERAEKKSGWVARQANGMGWLLQGLRYLLVPALLMLGGIGSAGAVQISLTSSQNPSLLRETVQLTATVSEGETFGTVYFYECPCNSGGGETLLGTVDIMGNGNAVLNYPFYIPGTHEVRVGYVGSEWGGVESSLGLVM